MMVAERGVNAVVALVFIMVNPRPKHHAPLLPSFDLVSSPQIFGGSGLKIPVKEIFLSGATQMLAMAASNEALRYVSYPTQVGLSHTDFSTWCQAPGSQGKMISPTR